MEPLSNREKERQKYYDFTDDFSMVRHPRTGQNLLMEDTDLLNGDTDTPVSQLSEGGQGIMCVKEVIGSMTCDMVWYVRIWCLPR
jgi:hypothetical protein